MHDHSSLKFETLQCPRHWIEKISTSNAQHLGLRTQGIDQGSQQVEHRSNPKAAAQRGQVHQRRVPGRGKQECDAGASDRIHHCLQRRLQIQTKAFQNISGADLATGTAISVFRHGNPTG